MRIRPASRTTRATRVGEARPPASRRLLAILLVLVTVNVAVFLVQRLLFVPLRVPSPSMQPALQVGDRILVQRSYSSNRERAHDIDRGDVLVFRAPDKEHKLTVKRVIGLPGEMIEAHDGVVAIDGTKVLVEKWLDPRELEGAAARSVDIDPQVLREDEIFVLGDNRDQSIDSRQFGPVDLDDVVGTVAVRFWPPRRFGTVDWT